ncbi:hypothetical protein IFM89_027131 [Coptis chinensis]|uniref:5'-deoxynucleotidase n=1 Tax=Coptis chinensis TaxID=261450 RepID=A0A835IYN8_9MAGN|nr:hypothetical protein IFM89_027131 [Coptis chinensis]
MAAASSSISSPPSSLQRISRSRTQSFSLLPTSKVGFSTRILMTTVHCHASLNSNENGFGSSKKSSSSSAIDFLTLCHSLKTTKRKGWINHGIKGPESIADHMYRMALMALIVGDLTGVDRERCIKIAIVHDIAEGWLSSLSLRGGYYDTSGGRQSMNPREMIIWAVLSENDCIIIHYGGHSHKNGSSISEDGSKTKIVSGDTRTLGRVTKNNSSLEANLVKDFDKVEMILQALEYEMEHGKVLDEFFLSTAGKFQTDIGKSWAAEIISRRTSKLGDKI